MTIADLAVLLLTVVALIFVSAPEEEIDEWSDD